jgi:hypothetical protein
MIPDLVDVGGPWKVLPPGVFEASLAEVESRFATNDHRRTLFAGLEAATAALVHAGCACMYLDGSYVTEASDPADFDVCWDSQGVDPTLLDPVFLDFDDGRRRQKAKYGGEFFPAAAIADGAHRFIDFFQVDKATGARKGIIKVRFGDRQEKG